MDAAVSDETSLTATLQKRQSCSMDRQSAPSAGSEPADLADQARPGPARPGPAVICDRLAARRPRPSHVPARLKPFVKVPRPIRKHKPGVFAAIDPGLSRI
jgi:hypothetical protein